MDAFAIEIAGFAVRVEPLYETTALYCQKYWTDCPADFSVTVERGDLCREQALLDLEADEEGLKRRKFSDPFLERSFIQRRVGELLLERKVLLMHGSTVAVDGAAYLFTAACGTGKSTHTRLWREVFGERAVMVNDDKPFLKLTAEGVLAYGSPWTGKHGLGGNVCFPLRGICVLKRGAENVIRRAYRDDVIDLIRHQCQLPEDDRQGAALLEELTERVALWQMKCNRDREAAITAYESMKLG